MNSTEQVRNLFEQAAYQRYLDQRAAGVSADCGEPAVQPDGLFWRQPDGNYGVLMFNAAWWGWQMAWGIASVLDP